MGIIPSRNLESQRREKDGIVYYDRGTLPGKNGRRYDRYAIRTHFVEVGEDQAELVRKYVLPLMQPGDVLSFGAKVMAMCTRNVKTKDEVHPGFWAKKLAPFAGINETGVGMHEPYKLQLVIDMCGLPKVLFAALISAVTRPFGVHGLFYKICGKGVAGMDKVALFHSDFKNTAGYFARDSIFCHLYLALEYFLVFVEGEITYGGYDGYHCYKT